MTIARTDATEVGRLIVKAMKLYLTPVRAFARLKLMLFAALATILIAGKLSGEWSRGHLRFEGESAEMPLAQVLLLVGAVLTIAFLNLAVLRWHMRTRERHQQQLLDLLRSSSLSPAERLQVLELLKEA
ncbi:MAG TPA: hypothetical protein VGB08_07015 [Allosphingosinicella sp.]|jgi:multisubunit Na+/H+ antiporter MnhC subunit